MFECVHAESRAASLVNGDLKLKFLENIKYSFHSIPIRRSNLLLYEDFEAMEFYFWI